MCGRLTLTTSGTEIADMFGLAYGQPDQRARRFNVAPSQLISVIRVVNGKRELSDLRWGLIPHWGDKLHSSGFINARAETVAAKPAFRDPFRSRRCLVPADGFYEWKHVGKSKQPYYFRKLGGGVLAYAGVWDTWTGPDGPIETVAVLTVPANELVLPYHDRMPAIMPREHFAAWLDPSEARPQQLLSLLVPYPVELMESWPVSERVNAAGTDDETMTLPMPEPPKPNRVQPSLFDVA